MKKVLVVLLILFLVGCIPPEIPKLPDSGKEETQELVRGRGLNVEILKPLFRYEEGEQTLKAEKNFDVVFKLSHSLFFDGVGGSISLESTSGVVDKIIVGEVRSFNIGPAEREENFVKPKELEVSFGPYFYSPEMKGENDGFKIDIVTSYSGFVESEICLGEEFGCGSDLKKIEGDNSVLPVAIDKIEKFVFDENNFELDISFKNYGSGSLEEGIENFYANLDDGSISCDDEVDFRDGRWRVECLGSKSLGKSRISFEFDYTYIEKEVFAFIVV